MPLLSDSDREALEQRFQQSLNEDVTLKLFTQSAARSLLTLPGQSDSGASELMRATEELLKDLAGTSDKLKLEIFDVHGDGADQAERLQIERIPAIVIGDDPEGRVRFYGAPVGNEFPTVLAGIEAQSTGEPMLSEQVADAAKNRINDAVHLRVFVTPT
jgi:hypothetical protein